MNLKILRYSIFCIVLGLIDETVAQYVVCNYGQKLYEFTSEFLSINNTYYSCSLNTEDFDWNENRIYLGGHHKSGQRDSNVKYLSIRNGNPFRRFSSIFCQKFQNLEGIVTQNARIESFDGNSFDNCLNLKHLEINVFKFSTLPEYLLYRNFKLEFISIKSGQLKSLPENFFVNQEKLVYLDLGWNEIDSLPSKIFQQLSKLQELNLGDNKLQSLNPEWFVNLENLKKLDLDDNQLTEITAGVFRPLRNLETLNLYRNRIKVLSAEAFDGLQSLKNLYLYNNEISELPNGVFSALINLQNLALADNKLTTIHSDSFSSELKKLLLRNNKINTVDPKIIDNKSFTYFDMENNICSSFWSSENNEIKANLQKCFQNYQIRSQHVTSVMTNSKSGISSLRVSAAHHSTSTARTVSWLATIVVLVWWNYRQ